jgi:hypothetical protein
MPERERIGDGWIPVVESPGEVLKAEQGTTDAVTESSVRVPFAPCLQELCRSADIAGRRRD